MQPLRILVLSSFNNPEWSSVPLVGYQHSAALAREHTVTLVTSASNQPALERAPQPFAEMIFIDQPWLLAACDWAFTHIFGGNHGRQGLQAIYTLVYLGFEWKVWRQLSRRLRASEFDVVLRLTPVSPMVPSPMARWLKRIGVPFVLGPINGGLPWPRGFSQAQREKEWISPFRKLARLLPYARSTDRSASAIIAGSSTTWTEFSRHVGKLFFIPENGIREDMIQTREPRAQRDPPPLALVCVGRLVPIKACDIVLKAAAPLLRSGRASLRLIGDGPERERLETLTASLGIAAQVCFTGTVSHALVMAEFRAADVLVFASVRDFGGGVVFEALASGTVPVVADFGGPSDLIAADRGVKIALTDEHRMGEDFAAALSALDADRERLQRLSLAGQAFARDHLTWTGKARDTTQVLRWVLGQCEAPKLFPPSVAVKVE